MMVAYLTMILLGLSLSMDTLAVSVTIGICKTDIRLRHAVKAALFFTFFQTLMPGLGYMAGMKITQWIEPYDHWVAFGLLALIGGKMIYDARHESVVANGDDAEACQRGDPTSSRRLVVLALATSIDALAAGISLAVSEVPILTSLLTIGLITFLVALAGALLGRRLGVVFHRNACLAGGIVLILIGLKIVADHVLIA